MSATYSGYLDFYRRGPFSPYVRETRSAGSTPVGLLEAAQPAGDFSDPATPDLTLQIPLTRGRASGDFGAGRWSGRFGPGDLLLSPAHTASSIVAEDAHEIRVVVLPFAGLRPLLDEAAPGWSDFGRLHATPFRDSLVDALCRRLWDEATNGNPLGSLFADAAVQTLALALLRLSGRAKLERNASPARGGLTPRQLRRVTAYVDAHLAEDFSLSSLGSAIELSPWHLARSFKKTTGASPLRYLQEKRIERAKELLSDSSLPLAEIALAVGFKSQDHFTAVFKRLTGATPGRYRRERLS